jgi:hypothetical protein
MQIAAAMITVKTLESPCIANVRNTGAVFESWQIGQSQGKPEFLVPGNQETTRPTGNSGKRKEITRKLP